MAATSLKLPDALKRRLESIASSLDKTPHAFMVETLAREADRLELKARFAADAAASERETLSSGMSVPLGVAFDYLENKLNGRKARRPRARSWRASK